MNEITKVYGTVVCNGIDCSVTNLFDVNGDETDDLDLAVTGVLCFADDQWVSFDCEATGIGALH